MREGDVLNFGYLKERIEERIGQLMVIFSLELKASHSYCSEGLYPFLYKTALWIGSDEHKKLKGIEIIKNKEDSDKRGGDIWSL